MQIWLSATGFLALVVLSLGQSTLGAAARPPVSPAGACSQAATVDEARDRGRREVHLSSR